MLAVPNTPDVPDTPETVKPDAHHWLHLTRPETPSCTRNRQVRLCQTSHEHRPPNAWSSVGSQHGVHAHAYQVQQVLGWRIVCVRVYLAWRMCVCQPVQRRRMRPPTEDSQLLFGSGYMSGVFRHRCTGLVGVQVNRGLAVAQVRALCQKRPTARAAGSTSLPGKKKNLGSLRRLHFNALLTKNDKPGGQHAINGQGSTVN